MYPSFCKRSRYWCFNLTKSLERFRGFWNVQFDRKSMLRVYEFFYVLCWHISFSYVQIISFFLLNDELIEMTIYNAIDKGTFTRERSTLMNARMIYFQSFASNVASKNHFYFCIIICPLLAQCIKSSPWVILSFAEFYIYQIKVRIGIPKFDVLIVANHSHFVRDNGQYGTGGWADRLVVINWYTNSPTLVRELYNIWRGSRLRCIWDSVMFFNCPWFHQIQYVISKNIPDFNEWME